MKKILVSFLIFIILGSINLAFAQKEQGEPSQKSLEEIWEEATALHKKRIALNPKDYVSLSWLGKIYWDQGKRREAIRYYRKVLKIEPNYPYVHFFLGEAYFYEKKPQKGKKEFNFFEEKIDLLPDKDQKAKDRYVRYLTYMSSIYLNYNMLKETKRLYKKILKLQPNDQIIHFSLGIYYYKHEHNTYNASKELNKVVEIDSDSKLAKSARKYMKFIRKYPDSRITSLPHLGETVAEFDRVFFNQMKLDLPDFWADEKTDNKEQPK